MFTVSRKKSSVSKLPYSPQYCQSAKAVASVNSMPYKKISCDSALDYEYEKII